MADLDLDRLESYIKRDRDAFGCVGLDYAEACELLRRARELERRDVILRRLVAAVDAARAKNATPAHEKELDDALDAAREELR